MSKQIRFGIQNKEGLDMSSSDNKSVVMIVAENDLHMINDVQRFVNSYIRRNEKNVNYNIDYLEIDSMYNMARVHIENTDNEIKLCYNLEAGYCNGKYSGGYIVKNIEVIDYFTNTSSLDDIFRDAVIFVSDYINNADSTDEECKILEFSFETGEFLVGILDFTKKKTVERLFSFEVEFNDSDDVVGVKYFGEVTEDMAECNTTDSDF